MSRNKNLFHENPKPFNNGCIPNANSNITDPEEYRRLKYYRSHPAGNPYIQNNFDESYSQTEENTSSKAVLPPIKKSASQPVLLFQLIICLIAAISVFVFKSIGGEIYDTIKEYYTSLVNSSDVISDFFPENQTELLEKTPLDTTLSDGDTYE